jgi:hypothetical protein
MEAEKVRPLPAFAQLHDPHVGVLEREPQLRQDRPRRRQGALGLCSGSAHHDDVVGVAHQHPDAALGPLPVEPMQIYVARAGRDHPQPAIALTRWDLTVEDWQPGQPTDPSSTTRHVAGRSRTSRGVYGRRSPRSARPRDRALHDASAAAYRNPSTFWHSIRRWTSLRLH